MSAISVRSSCTASCSWKAASGVGSKMWRMTLPASCEAWHSRANCPTRTSYEVRAVALAIDGGGATGREVSE